MMQTVFCGASLYIQYILMESTVISNEHNTSITSYQNTGGMRKTKPEEVGTIFL